MTSPRWVTGAWATFCESKGGCLVAAQGPRPCPSSLRTSRWPVRRMRAGDISEQPHVASRAHLWLKGLCIGAACEPQQSRNKTVVISHTWPRSLRRSASHGSQAHSKRRFGSVLAPSATKCGSQGPTWQAVLRARNIPASTDFIERTSVACSGSSVRGWFETRAKV